MALVQQGGLQAAFDSLDEEALKGGLELAINLRLQVLSADRLDAFPAEQAEVELPLAQHLKALLRAAVEAGYADDDFMALYLHLRGAASVRIFTPSFEMPFAGHPTLGTAHVVRALRSTGDSLSLEMTAGVIPVSARGDVWTLVARAPRARPPRRSP